MNLLIQDTMTPEQTKKFKYWQTRTIVVTMVGYALYYFVRKNFNTAMPSSYIRHNQGPTGAVSDLERYYLRSVPLY